MTSGNKSFKILFCLGEIVLFSIKVFFFASGNHYWNHAEANFNRKTSLLLEESVFLAETVHLVFSGFSCEKPLFQLSDNPGSEKSFSQGKYFLTNCSFRLVETYFLSSSNSIALFRALLKILKFEGSNLDAPREN